MSKNKKKELQQFTKNIPLHTMRIFQQNTSNRSISRKIQLIENVQDELNNSMNAFTATDSIQSSDYSERKENSAISRFYNSKNQSEINNEDSFYSESDQIRIEEILDDELILQKKVQKKDIIFKTKHFKDTFSKYFTEVIYGFLKQPNDLTFAIALDRLKYYNQQSPFLQRKYHSHSLIKQTNNSFESLRDTQTSKSYTANSKCSEKTTQSNQNFEELSTVQQLLVAMFYENKHRYMIYTFDYNLCHLTFIAAMLYFWSKVDHSVTHQYSNFTRISLTDNLKFFKEKNSKFKQQSKNKQNIFEVLKLYIQERSQSLNISQINILIVFFFLSYLKNSSFFEFSEEKIKQISQIQQKFITNLKLYRRIKKLQKQFNNTSDQVIFQSQLHKYQYENKLISSMEKTFQIFQLITTHNFVSNPIQKYFQLYEFKNSRKIYQTKKDNFCLWVLNIILRICEKRSVQSLSKCSYYILTFLAILKKFKEAKNFEGISMILPILYNIKEQLPKAWSYTLDRRKQINQKLLQYSNILMQKIYKRQDIPESCNAIISDQVIYEMCDKFCQYTHVDKQNLQNNGFLNLQKHRKFFQQFLTNVVFHRKQIHEQYFNEIQDYKKQKQIGISFNMYLLDTYVCKSYKGINTKILWTQMIEKSKLINQQINNNIYIDIIEYWFVGSSLKSKQLDI